MCVCVCVCVCVLQWVQLPKLAPAADLNNNTSLFDLTHKTMSAACSVCVSALVHVSKSTPASKCYIGLPVLRCVCVCVCVCASWEAGEVTSGNDDEQTLRGRIISHYPQFPDAALRRWARLDSSHGQKRVESLTRFIRPSQTPRPPFLPPPLLSSCFLHLSVSSLLSATCCLPYVLNPLRHWHTMGTDDNVMLEIIPLRNN